jgi:hypothetical protein
MGDISSGDIESAPVLIDVERSDAPVSVVVQPTFFSIQGIGAQTPIPIYGIYADGTNLYLSNSTQTVLVSNNTAIATVGGGEHVPNGINHCVGNSNDLGHRDCPSARARAGDHQCFNEQGHSGSNSSYGQRLKFWLSSRKRVFGVGQQKRHINQPLDSDPNRCDGPPRFDVGGGISETERRSEQQLSIYNCHSVHH